MGIKLFLILKNHEKGILEMSKQCLSLQLILRFEYYMIYDMHNFSIKSWISNYGPKPKSIHPATATAALLTAQYVLITNSSSINSLDSVGSEIRSSHWNPLYYTVWHYIQSMLEIYNKPLWIQKPIQSRRAAVTCLARRIYINETLEEVWFTPPSLS